MLPGGHFLALAVFFAFDLTVIVLLFAIIFRHLVRVLGTDLVPCAERSREQFRYAADIGKVDDPESGSHFPIVSFLGLALGRSRHAASRTDIVDNLDFL
jgi:hypothetical protein